MDLAITNALKDADLTPEQVDLMITQGTGVPAEDVAEAAAWQAALGPRAKTVPAAALTGAIGFGFAGDRGIALGTGAMALARQTVPPTAGHAKPAAGCELNLSSEPRSAKIRHAVVAGFSCTGQSAACVLRRVDS
jgi:3-oxoacyl-(acyl-carrier-protein) synthase